MPKFLYPILKDKITFGAGQMDFVKMNSINNAFFISKNLVYLIGFFVFASRFVLAYGQPAENGGFLLAESSLAHLNKTKIDGYRGFDLSDACFFGCMILVCVGMVALFWNNIKDSVRGGEENKEALIRRAPVSINRVAHRKPTFREQLAAIKGKLPKEGADDLRANIDAFEKEYQCPISYKLMNEPVTLSSGQTFDRRSIVGLFNSALNIRRMQIKCPLSNKVLTESANTPLNESKFISNQMEAQLTSLNSCLNDILKLKSAPTENKQSGAPIFRTL